MIDKRLIEAVPGAERLKSAMITPELFVKDLMQDYSGRPLYNTRNGRASSSTTLTLSRN